MFHSYHNWQWKGFVSLQRLQFITDSEKKIPILLDMVFPVPWLEEVSETDPEGRKNRTVMELVSEQPYDHVSILMFL